MSMRAAQPSSSGPSSVRPVTGRSLKDCGINPVGVISVRKRDLREMSQDQWGSVSYLVAALLFGVWWRLRIEDQLRHQDNEDKDE
jgi:hypothetical protein